MQTDDSEEAVTYRSLKAQHKKLEHDFITMTKIIGLLSTLTKNYQVRGYTWWGREGWGREGWGREGEVRGEGWGVSYKNYHLSITPNFLFCEVNKVSFSCPFLQSVIILTVKDELVIVISLPGGWSSPIRDMSNILICCLGNGYIWLQKS